MPLLMFGAAFGTHSNFIIGADRIRRCLIVSCCAGNVIARRISARGRQQIRPGGRRGGSKAEKSKTHVISICVRRTPKSGHRLSATDISALRHKQTIRYLLTKQAEASISAATSRLD